MKVRGPSCICALALVSLLGCKGSPDRPANVPAKAHWTDGVFIECSLDKTSHANRCTVYDGASGEIQVSGFFILSGSGREAKEDELLYQAFDGTTILLQDARTLDLILLTEHKVPDLENRLTALAGIKALNCGRAVKDSQAYGISDCALEAFAEGKAFYVSYEYGVWAPGSSFGFARDARGNLYFAEYTNARLPLQPMEEIHFSEDKHTRFGPCPKPTCVAPRE